MDKIYVMYGSQPEKMVKTILQKMNIAKDLQKLTKAQPLIGIKPNLVVAQPAHWGATTSPDLVRGVINFLQSLGFSNLVIMESSWIGESTKKAFKVCGYEQISQELNIPLIDLKEDTYRHFDVDGTKIRVCQEAINVDYLINMPVLKAHCQTKLTCALKNLKGCIPDIEKRRFHALGLHHPIACLNKLLTSHLTIVDGIIGDLTHEEGGNPVRMNRVIGGRDPVLVDTYVAELIGYTPADIKYIALAEKLGVGTTNLTPDKIVELNSTKDAPHTGEIPAGNEVDYLQQWILEDKACSACYGSLVHALKRLKERGKLARLPKRICIGQGYKGRQAQGIGIGSCTAKLKEHVSGCPPRAQGIIHFLEEWLEKNST